MFVSVAAGVEVVDGCADTEVELEASGAGVTADVGSEAVGCEMATAAAPITAATDKRIMCFML